MPLAALLARLACSPRQARAFLYALTYVLGTVGEVLALRALALLPLRLPAFTALLSNQMWVLLVPSHALTALAAADVAPTVPPRERALQYAVCGVLTGAITILRNVSIQVMTASVFALLISTSILFAVALSRFVLGAPLNRFHYAAVLACLASASSISGEALATSAERVDDSNYSLGVPGALGAAFCVALMGIAQERYQRRWEGANFALYLSEMTLASSLIASATILLFGAATGEIARWPAALARAAARQPAAAALLAGVCAVLPLLKLVVRQSKYLVIQNSSALFFEFVGAGAALTTSIAAVIAFSEPFGPGFVVALVLLALGFLLYSRAKIEARRARDAAAAARKADGASPPTTPRAGDAGDAAGAALVVVQSPAAAVEAWGERPAGA